MGAKIRLENRSESTEVAIVNARVLYRMIRDKKPLPNGYCICVGCKHPRKEHKESFKCKACFINDGMGRIKPKQPAVVPTPTETPESERQEARRSRAWQLATVLRPGPASFFMLRQEGWLETAIMALRDESPDYFQYLPGNYVGITGKCRREVLQQKD